MIFPSTFNRNMPSSWLSVAWMPRCVIHNLTFWHAYFSSNTFVQLDIYGKNLLNRIVHLITESRLDNKQKRHAVVINLLTLLWPYLSESCPDITDPNRYPIKYVDVVNGTFHSLSQTRSHCKITHRLCIVKTMVRRD